MRIYFIKIIYGIWLLFMRLHSFHTLNFLHKKKDRLLSSYPFFDFYNNMFSMIENYLTPGTISIITVRL
jgi:hypothetical protein